MDKLQYLFWAYAAIWALIFAYTVYLGIKQNNLVKELELLKGALKERSK